MTFFNMSVIIVAFLLAYLFIIDLYTCAYPVNRAWNNAKEICGK